MYVDIEDLEGEALQRFLKAIYERIGKRIEGLQIVESMFDGSLAPIGNLQLLHEDYIVDYAVDMIDDYDGVGKDHWLSDYIDWEGAAQALVSDLIDIEVNGHTYYII